MTETELLKQEIKMLQSKLEFLEELEKTKSPVEEAFKRVYGTYPSSYDTSVFWTESDEDTWISFQKGYTSAKENYKVEEPEEPEELKTLYQMFYDEKWSKSGCDDFCKVVKEWMSQYTHNVMTGEYLKGYEECLTVLEENLK